jgi:hypothetical protein
MRRERRKPTRREWAQITSARPVVRRVIKSVTLCRARNPLHAGEAPPFGPDLTKFTKDDERGAS